MWSFESVIERNRNRNICKYDENNTQVPSIKIDQPLGNL